MGAGISELRTVIDDLRSEDVDSLAVETLAENLVALETAIGWLEGERGRRVRAFDAKRGQDLGGHSSTTAFLKDRCHMSGARAQRTVALAQSLGSLPQVEKAMTAGDLSLDQVRVFSHLPSRLAEDLANAEVTLVNAVNGLSVANTRRLVEYWRSAVDGAGVEADAAELADRRYLFASRTLGDMVKVDGLLDPLAGDLFLTALQAATPPPSEGDPRNPGQRRADSLADIVRSFLDSGDAPGTEKPHVLVLTDLDALEGHGGGTHETESGLVLTPEQTRMYACDCALSRVVFGADSHVLDIGRTTRIIPNWMRRAVVARDRHCTHPGCDRPGRWADVHHIWHWADGGPTALWNLRLLCRYHHTLQHRLDAVLPSKLNADRPPLDAGFGHSFRRERRDRLRFPSSEP